MDVQKIERLVIQRKYAFSKHAERKRGTDPSKKPERWTENYRLKEALTTDEHFKQAGFRALLIE